MSTVLTSTADLTNAADAWRRGMPTRVGGVNAESTGPTNTQQSQATDPPVFPRDPTSAGFKLALVRIMRLGGNMGTPSGPPPGGHRMRRVIGKGYAPTTTDRTAQRMPAGLIPTGPAWEDYLSTGADSYLAR